MQATLRGRPRAGRNEAPTLDLQAGVLPFAVWPLATLQAATTALDLSDLASDAPVTSLTGTAQVQTEGLDRPARVAIELSNARAGRIDEGRLPVRSMKADVSARPDDPKQVEIRAVDLMLGTERAAAGRLQGQGRWTPQRLTLDATLADIQPRLLDARAPALRFSGSANLQADGWFESAPSSPPSASLRSRITGSVARAGGQERLQLDLDAGGTAQRIDLRRATLQAGASQASLSGQAVHRGRGAWQVNGHGTVANVDPAMWWPGPEGSAWQHGPNALNGTLDVDLLLPARTRAPRGALETLALLNGQAALKLTDSKVAGTPVVGDLSLRGGAANTGGVGVEANLALAGARFGARGKLDTDSAGARDHWELDARGVDLAKLAPLLQVLQPKGMAPPPLAGRAEGTFALDGRWPNISSRGTLSLKDASSAGARVAQGKLRWTLGTAPGAPIDVLAEVEQLAAGVQKLDSLRLAIQGTAEDHTLTLNAASPARPPRWIELLRSLAVAPAQAALSAKAGVAPAPGTRAELRARGALKFDTAWQRPLQWQGKLQLLEAGGREAGAATPWIRIGDIGIEAQYDPATKAPAVNVGAGRADLQNLGLRWTQMRWQGGAKPVIDVQAELEAFSVAPLLKRLQPDFGWGGDLVVGGRVNVHSAPAFVAEIELARRSGDLGITDEFGTQMLDLTDLRLALDAHDGVWRFTHALAGKTLGATAGAVTARTDAKQFWPPPDAPVSGVLEARVDRLDAFGAWVPAGWRLKGAIHASAAIAGTVGAPAYTGQIDGSGLGVRNLLEGVDLHDGELAIVLQGDTARIEKMQVRGGDGTLRISGDATFGATPQAQLALVAERLQVIGRVDRRIVASGNAKLLLQRESLKLDGSIGIDEGLFDFSRSSAPTLGDDVTVVRPTVAAAASATEPASERVSTRELNTNVVLNLGQSLKLRGRGLDTRLRGEVTLTTPGGRLAVNGSVETYQGTYAAYGQRLEIERGVVVFSGPAASPRLDILALRPNLDIRVGVAITGTPVVPRIRLFSEPDLPDSEKLSWLVLGRAPDGLSRGDTGMLQAAAMALLAGEGDTPTAELTRLLGLDQVSVRQSDGEVRNTVVSVGKQLSKNWYIGYERSLNNAAGNWQLIYRIAQRFTLRAQSGSENSLDLLFSWRWD